MERCSVNWILLGIVLVLSLSFAHADFLSIVSADSSGADNKPQGYVSVNSRSLTMSVFPDNYAGYEYEIWLYPSMVYVDGASTISSEHTFSGLSPSTSYFLRVRGITDGVYSEYYSTAVTTTSTGLGDCNILASANPITSGQVSKVSGDCLSSSYYSLAVADNKGVTVGSDSKPFVNSLKFSVPNPSVQYIAKMQRTFLGNNYWTYDVFTSGSCYYPTLQVTTSATHDSITAVWDAPSGYNYYSYELKQGTQTISYGTTTGFSKTFTGLQSITAYTLIVRGYVNSDCPNGNVVTATVLTKPQQVTDFNLTVDSVGSTWAYASVTPDVATQGYSWEIYYQNNTFVKGFSTNDDYYNFTGLQPSTYSYQMKYRIKVTAFISGDSLTKYSEVFATLNSSAVYDNWTMGIDVTPKTFSADYFIYWNHSGVRTFAEPFYELYYKIDLLNSTNGTLGSSNVTTALRGYTVSGLLPNTTYKLNITSVNGMLGNQTKLVSFTTSFWNSSNYRIYYEVTPESKLDYNSGDRTDVDVNVSVLHDSYPVSDIYYELYLNGTLIGSNTSVGNFFILYNKAIGTPYFLVIQGEVNVSGTLYTLAPRNITVQTAYINTANCPEGKISGDFKYYFNTIENGVSVSFTPNYSAQYEPFVSSTYSINIFDENDVAPIGTYSPSLFFHKGVYNISGIPMYSNYTYRLLKITTCVNNANESVTVTKRVHFMPSSNDLGIFSFITYFDYFLPSIVAKFLALTVIGVLLSFVFMWQMGKYGVGVGWTGFSPLILMYILGAGLGWIPTSVIALVILIVVVVGLYLVYSQLRSG